MWISTAPASRAATWSAAPPSRPRRFGSAPAARSRETTDPAFRLCIASCRTVRREVRASGAAQASGRTRTTAALLERAAWLSGLSSRPRRGAAPASSGARTTAGFGLLAEARSRGESPEAPAAPSPPRPAGYGRDRLRVDGSREPAQIPMAGTVEIHRISHNTHVPDIMSYISLISLRVSCAISSRVQGPSKQRGDDAARKSEDRARGGRVSSCGSSICEDRRGSLRAGNGEWRGRRRDRPFMDGSCPPCGRRAAAGRRRRAAAAGRAGRGADDLRQQHRADVR